MELSLIPSAIHYTKFLFFFLWHFDKDKNVQIRVSYPMKLEGVSFWLYHVILMKGNFVL